MSSKIDFPQFILKKWQKLIDLHSSSFDLPATLIMQIHGDSPMVFAKCKTENNPYVVGASDKLLDFYCESVIRSGQKLLVSNVLVDSECGNIPDIKPEMIAYLGFPIKYPNGKLWGILCVLDNKENAFSEIIEEFLLQIKDIIELDISVYDAYEKTSSEHESKLTEQFKSIGLKKKPDIEGKLARDRSIHKILDESLNSLDKELMNSESKYETLFTSMNSAIVIFEAICGFNGNLYDAKYLDMNPQNEKLTGSKKEEVIGKTLLEVFPEIGQDWFRNFNFVVKHKDAVSFDSFHKPLGKYFSVNAFPIDDHVFALSYYDITERIVVKQKLRDSEKRYKTIFYDSSSVMLLLNPADGAIIDANAAAIQFYGFAKEELLSMNMCDINVTPNVNVLEEMKWAKQRKKNHFLFKHRLASGEIRDVEVYSGQIKSDNKEMLHSVIHDVTESRKTLKEVKRLSKAVEQSPVSIVITDINGDIQYCNPKHCEMTGYSREEMLGTNPRILKSGINNKDFYHQLWKSILRGDKWDGEFFNKKKNGSFHWESASIAPIKDEKGDIVNFIKIGEDISERKRLENQLSQSKLKAEESDKLKSSFLANLSHEVRTPLNGIMGFTNLMLCDDITDEERKEYGAFVTSSGNQLMLMMNDILKISAIESGKLSVKYSTFQVQDILLEIVNDYSHQISEKKLNIKIESSCESTIRNDRKRIRQVFDNLIRNAIKFTEEGRITIGAEYNHDMLVLFVQDTGIGIAPADHSKIFDRFRQVDNYSTRKFEGTGLGLAISREIVILLGGEIWLESDIGKGAKFIFTIPHIAEEV